MNAKYLVAFAASILVIVLLLSGCSGATPTTSGAAASPAASPSLTARQVLDNSAAALKQSETFQLVTKAGMDLEIKGGTQPGKVSLQVTGSSALDSARRQLHTTNNLTMALPTMGTQTLALEVFVVNGWVYTKYSLPGAAEQWVKVQLNDQQWSQMGQNYLSDIFASAINVDLAGSETINGVDYYVLVLTPDTQALSAFLQSQLGQANPAISGLDFSQMFQQVTFKSWVDKKSFLPLKQTLNFALTLTPADFKNLNNAGSYFDSMSLNFSAGLEYSNFGKAVAIDLPQKALDAPQTTLPSAPK